MVAVSILIPFRASDESRIKNLRAVVAHFTALLPSAEILIAEQDVESQIEGIPEFDHCHKYLAASDTDFHKSKLLNSLAAKAREPLLLMCDADIILSESGLMRSLQAVSTELDFVRPFADLIDLDSAQTVAYLQHGYLPDAAKHGESTNRTHFGEQLCLAGGAFIIRNDVYQQLGGFDERFIGWGGEDNAFSLLVESKVSKSAILRQGTAWHLWHPRANSMGSEQYRRNVSLLRKLQSELSERPPEANYAD